MWRVTFVVKRTMTDQVGPSTSDEQLVDVTVINDHVAAWTPVAAS